MLDICEVPVVMYGKQKIDNSSVDCEIFTEKLSQHNKKRAIKFLNRETETKSLNKTTQITVFDFDIFQTPKREGQRIQDPLTPTPKRSDYSSNSSPLDPGWYLTL